MSIFTNDCFRDDRLLKLLPFNVFKNVIFRCCFVRNVVENVYVLSHLKNNVVMRIRLEAKQGAYSRFIASISNNGME